MLTESVSAKGSPKEVKTLSAESQSSAQSSWLLFQQWLQYQHSDAANHIYLIVDPHNTDSPLLQFSKLGGIDATPLLHPDDYQNARQNGPYLLPLSKEMIRLFLEEQTAPNPTPSPQQLLLTCGIWLSSQQPKQITKQHFASLFEANFAGETVLFPYYYPERIGPMLANMKPYQRHQLLFNHEIGFCWNQHWFHYNCVPLEEDQHLKQKAWWQIQPDHLSAKENLPLIEQNLQCWLWQHQPQIMRQHLQQGSDFSAMMRPYLTGNQPDNLATAAHETPTPARSLTNRVLCAAIFIILGPHALEQLNYKQFIQENQQHEVLYSLHLLDAQLKKEK